MKMSAGCPVFYSSKGPARMCKGTGTIPWERLFRGVIGRRRRGRFRIRLEPLLRRGERARGPVTGVENGGCFVHPLGVSFTEPIKRWFFERICGAILMSFSPCGPNTIALSVLPAQAGTQGRGDLGDRISPRFSFCFSRSRVPGWGCISIQITLTFFLTIM